MKIPAAIAIGALATAGWAQDNNGITARQLFLNTPPAAGQTVPTPKKLPKLKQPDSQVKVTPPVMTADNPKPKIAETSSQTIHASYTPLALKYTLLQRKGTTYQEVSPDTEFRSGDHIRVSAQSNATAYLYIVMGGSSGQWQVMFPSKEIDDGNNRIEAGQTRSIPFYFDETSGVEKLSLVLTRSPEPDLEKLIYEAGDPTRNGAQPAHKTMIAQESPIDGSVVGHLREQVLSRDLVFEKCDGSTPDCDQEKAVYAATKDKSPGARLFVDLKLVHK